MTSTPVQRGPSDIRRWLAAIGLVGVLAIVGAVFDELRWLHYACKPLATLLILAFAWRHGASSSYRAAVMTGLVLSTFGDVALMLPVDAFVIGLVAFLLAHIAYLVAFASRARPFARLLPFAVYALVAGAVLSILWPHLPGDLRIPVVAYVAVLACMAAQAAVAWQVNRDASCARAAIGAAVFVVSDAALAIDRFAMPFTGAIVVVLATYWIAQTLLAASTCDATYRRDRQATGDP